MALGLTGMRLVLSGIERYKTELADNISATIGTPVTIGRLSAKMRGFNPELVLKDIAIASVAHEDPAVALKEIRLGVNLLELFVNRDWLSSAWVTLVGAKLSVQRKADGSFAVIGLKARDGQPLWLFQGNKFEVLQSEIIWQDAGRKAAPLKFESVNLSVINTDGRHKINMLAMLPKHYGDSLTVSADISGDPFAAAAMDGLVFVDGKNLQAAHWLASGLPWGMAVQSGSADIKLWGRLQRSQLLSVSGATQVRGIKLLRPGKGEYAVNSLGSRFHWRLDEGKDNTRQWRLDVKQLVMETADPLKRIKKWPDTVFSVSGSHSSVAELQKMALYIEQVDLQQAAQMALFFAPIADETAALLAQAEVKGRLNRLALFADLQDHTVAVAGSFTGLSYAPLLAIPGIQNLSGRIQGTDRQGVVRFSTKDATVTSPALFREALVVKRLAGALSWKQDQDGWLLSSSSMNLDLLGLQSESRLRVSLPKNHEAPLLDMQTALVCDDASQLKHYFPTGVMKPADIDWLDRAFVSGRVQQGHLSYYGKLGPLAAMTAMPGKKARPNPRPDILPGEEGAYHVLASEMIDGALFEALLDVRELELDYAPSWPRITDIAGELVFLQGRMEVNAYQGYSKQLKTGKAVVINEAVGKSKVLLVQGEVDGEIAEALRFLQETPLNSRMGALIDAIAPQGSTRVTLDLAIPLARGVEPKVDGSATLDHAGLTVKAVDVTVSNIDGLLRFNEQGIYSDAIDAAAFDHPIRINIDNGDSQTRVNVSGKAEIHAIEKQFGLPAWGVADGAMTYQLKLTLPYEHLGIAAVHNTAAKAAELAVDSDLTGVGLSLPGSLAKTKLESRPLSVVFSLGDKALLPMTVAYDHKLTAALRFDTAKQRIASGHVLLGKGVAVQTDDPGIKLEINSDKLDLKDWLAMPTAKNSRSDVDIRELAIHSADAQWGDTPLGLFDLALKPDGSYWAGNINSVFAKGKVHLPVATGKGRISLDMEMLDLSALQRLKSRPGGQPSENSGELLPDDMPLFDMTSYKTLWESVDLGLLSVKTERMAHGIVLTKLELDGLAQKLDLSGSWKRNAGVMETSVAGHLDMPNAGTLLAQLGISHDLVETSGAVDFSLHWQGAPQQFSLAALNGEMDIHFTDGRILSIEPGFGRMLGILAMAQWIKRVQLDFRDIYQQGLTFNTIKGHFMVLNGKASTQNLVVDAVPATITITGDTDLVNKTIDQLVNVAPKGADAVPIAGTIMDKVTSLIARTITGEDQEGFLLGSQYLVKGSWDAMQVIPLHDHDGLLQKTWTGITGFPWLPQQQ